VFLNLAYEQIFQNINENLKAPKDEFSKKWVIHHAWGRNYFEYLTKFGVCPENIVINGNLSYALYKYPYRKYFLSRNELAEKFNLNASKKWLFIPENYGAAFYTEKILEEKINKGIDSTDVIKYRDFATKSLKEVIKWCARILKSDDIEIIFRPRPSTSSNRMEDFFTEVLPEIPKGLHIIKDHTVREWILASDIIMSSYSTTLIEAAIAEKPIAMLTPHPFPDYLNASWYYMVPKIESYEEFLSKISSPTPESYKSLKYWAESELMSKGDPIKGLVNLMLAVKKSGIRVPETYSKKCDDMSFHRIIQTIFDCIYSINHSFFNKSPIIIEDYENDYFTNADIKQRVDRWQKVLKSNK